MQTRKGSLVESITNTIVGFIIGFVSQAVIFSFYGIKIPAVDNAVITIWFTLLSIARSYTIRRCFNKKALNDASRN